MGYEELDQKNNKDEDYERKILVSLSKLKKHKGVELNQDVTKKSEHMKCKLPGIPLPEYSNAKDQSLQKFLYSLRVSSVNILFLVKEIHLFVKSATSNRVLVFA